MLYQMKIILLTNLFQSLKLLVSTTTTSGISLAKFNATLKLSLFIAPMSLITGFHEWAAANAAYIDLVMLAIFFDWFLGTIKHAFWCRDFHWKENIKGIIVKTMLTLIVGGVFEGLRHMTIEYTNITSYLITILRLTVFLYPAMGIIRSARVISDGKFPPQSIYDRIENWTKEIGKKK